MLDLGFERQGERTVLARRVFRWPFVVMRPFQLDANPAHMASVIVQSSSGAVQRGDRLRQRIAVGPRAGAYVTTQGAQSIHAAGEGLAAQETIRLQVAAGGHLEYLPEPRILFPDADLIAEVDLDCATHGVALVADAFGWHDPTQAGRTPRRLRSTTRIRIDGGAPVSIDRADIGDFSAKRSGFATFGSMALVAPGREVAALCGDVNAALAGVEGLYAAASALPGDAGVGLRFAGRELRDVRAGMQLAWAWSRAFLTGAPPARRRKD